MGQEKKKLLKEILEALTPYRDMAEGFLILMKNEENDEILDALFDIIYAEIKNIKNEKHRETIRKTLKKIKGKEENSENDKYLENLINNI